MSSVLNDVYSGKTVIFFDENVKDFARSFWSRGENLVWPCIRGARIDYLARLLVDTDREIARRVRSLLDGDCITMENVSFYCRVSDSLAPTQAAAEELSVQLFKRCFKGDDGFFKEPFMRARYELVQDSVKVTRYSMQKLPQSLAYLFDPQESAKLKPYSSLLDFHYDIRLQLIRPLPRLTPDDLESPFVYVDHDKSIYQAAEFFLSHPDKLILDTKRQKLMVRPKDEKLNDQLFLDDFYSAQSLDTYTIAGILSEFSNDPVLQEKMEFFKNFTDLGTKHAGCYYYYETGFTSHSHGTLFSNQIYLELMESFVRWDAVENLLHVCEIIEQVLKTPQEQLSDSVKVFNNGLGTKLRLKTVGQYALHKRKMKNTSPEQIRKDLQTFMDRLKIVQQSCEAILTYIRSNVPRTNFYEELKAKLGEMMIRAIKCDPFSYIDHDHPVIRKYANVIASGEC
ncbi:MAG: hypothetical protein MJY98_11050 [Fibrobacter sp.]|nr:hypothetical protein [Fibrobacter sp.]